MNTRNKKTVNTIIAVWVLLWIFFLVRPDKDGQYGELAFFHTHGYEEKVKHLMGDELYGFLGFCKDNIPAGATYELYGFDKFSIYEVRMRYYLWPIRGVDEGGDYIIMYRGSEIGDKGYKEYMDYKGDGKIFKRKEV